MSSVISSIKESALYQEVNSYFTKRDNRLVNLSTSLSGWDKLLKFAATTSDIAKATIEAANPEQTGAISGLKGFSSALGKVREGIRLAGAFGKALPDTVCRVSNLFFTPTDGKAPIGKNLLAADRVSFNKDKMFVDTEVFRRSAEKDVKKQIEDAKKILTNPDDAKALDNTKLDAQFQKKLQVEGLGTPNMYEGPQSKLIALGYEFLSIIRNLAQMALGFICTPITFFDNHVAKVGESAKAASNTYIYFMAIDSGAATLNAGLLAYLDPKRFLADSIVTGLQQGSDFAAATITLAGVQNLPAKLTLAGVSASVGLWKAWDDSRPKG